MLSPDFAIGALIGMTLWRVIYYFCGGYKEQDAYKAGYEDGHYDAGVGKHKFDALWEIDWRGGRGCRRRSLSESLANH